MGYRSIRCKTCGKSPISTALIVIGNMIYCQQCLKNISVKSTGEHGRYYTHSGDRCFVNFGSDSRIDIQEFGVDELKIGNTR
ncbi:hypothetical protein [Marinisporobacter balticus]|uniref:Uncharacterized protein n=1 Tax=Marinisporobacter balticus TaxID=2018667 RepID=A0A4R2KYH3_9FIRM|nr:hypothetical protein [Marinisporobacter balticus]TCO79114.1 hypothetical protein EV214_103166 [Marinisporobacter balticus]